MDLFENVYISERLPDEFFMQREVDLSELLDPAGMVLYFSCDLVQCKCEYLFGDGCTFCSVFAEFAMEQKEVIPELPDAFVHRGERQCPTHCLFVAVCLWSYSPHHVNKVQMEWWNDGMMECTLKPSSSFLQIHQALEFAPLPVLRPEPTRCSSLSPGQHQERCRPFVSIQNAVPATHNPTFLHRVMASWNDVPAPSIG